MRSMWPWIVVTLGVIAVIWGGWWRFEQERFQRELEHAEREIAGGRYRLARQRLVDLTKRHPRSNEVAYQLGLCEENLGHSKPPSPLGRASRADSPLFIKASIGRVLVLMNLGRYSLAEELLATIPRDQGPYAAHVRQQIEVLLRIEGRIQEARELIVEAWQGAADPSDVLKRLYLLEDPRFPSTTSSRLSREVIRTMIAFGSARPIWRSGRAGSTTRRRWLDACEQQRPDDQPVWLARLSLAMSSGDLDGARRAVKHVNAAWFLPSEVLRIRAWLAAFRGDDRGRTSQSCWPLSPRSQATRLPGRGSPSWRIKAGRRAEAESFRKKQSEAAALRDRYDRLIMHGDRGQHADELARLAQRAGTPDRSPRLVIDPEGRAADEPLWPPERGEGT